MLGPKFPDIYCQMTKVPLLKETRGGSSKCPTYEEQDVFLTKSPAHFIWRPNNVAVGWRKRERESWEITLCFDAGNLFTTQALFLDLLFMCVFDRKMWGSGSVIAAALMFHSCIRWPFSIVYKHVVSLQIVHSRPNIRITYCIYLWKEKYVLMVNSDIWQCN